MKAGYKGKDKYLVWHIEGGLGKNIAATSLISSIKKKYVDRKIIIVCSYPENFLNFPDIDRVYPVGNTPYFYQDYIEDKDTLVFRHEGYFQNGHIKKEQHLIKSWCELLHPQPQLRLKHQFTKTNGNQNPLRLLLDFRLPVKRNGVQLNYTFEKMSYQHHLGL